MIGRIVGEGISKLAFRTYYHEKVSLGEVLVVRDEDCGEKLFVRVIDIAYGSDAHDESWMERTAGNILTMERKGEEYRIHDRERRFYQLGIAVPLGYSRNGGLVKAKTLPAHLSPVLRPSEEDYGYLKNAAGDLKIGLLRSGDRVIDIPVGIWGKDIPQHIGIFATTGMGKSNLMRVLAGSVIESRRYGLLLMDPHGEYLRGPSPGEGGLFDVDSSGERIVVFSSHPGHGERRLALSATEVEPADLAEVYGVTEAQRELAYAAKGLWGDGWCSAIHKHDAEPLTEVFDGNFNVATASVLKRRIDTLFSMGVVLDKREKVLSPPVIEALSQAKTVLVDTSYLGSREEMLVLSVLTRKVFEHARRAYGKDRDRFTRMPPILITVEEAQRVLGRERNTVFSKLAREGRKFKVGICAISQQPKLLNPEVISQLNTLFILGLADKRDRDILKESAKQDVSALSKEIQTLGVGEGVVASPGLPFAVPFRVHHFAALYKGRRKDAPPPRIDDGFF